MEHSKIKCARNYLRSRGIKYQIKGPNDALYLLFEPVGAKRHYWQICYSILNFSSDEAIIEFLEGEVNKLLSRGLIKTYNR